MEIITKELIRNCVFGIKCDKNWKDMEHIRTDENDRDVRFCSSCEKEVYETITKDDLYTNIELNRCVLMRNEQYELMGHVVAPGLE